MKLDPLVAKIIVATNFDHFTTSDVRSAYIALKKDPSLDPIKVRRNIYADLLKLTKKGWLKRLMSNKKSFTRFNKTELFDVNELNLLAEVNAATAVHTESEYNKHDKLLSKLNQYKAELLLNIGESEAYKELYSEFPELVDEIQPEFNKARDNNTRILGKIRAIEGLLAQDESLGKK
ncbi:hypothetical protein Q4503_12025 [Colwellia sp. 6_MG-2023]|uniref:hypothetical protein n=1 Tax=Colwellia sp. 6_MG-2023 TaxID=3062676 RepID=UPI0026E1F41E|nr:hypothetical protein [Colwellia sp. 6_MG-2023]MDO6488434.1 hypothetical protein [Colwellia sp. 6_MG-2023]